MDLTVIGYLLFIIPGFCLVWTYRHFTKAKQISEFEYAAWSFLWGTAMFFLAMKYSELRHAQWPSISTDNPLLFAGAMLGMGLGIALVIAFPLGYLGALFAKLFKWIDIKLFQSIEWISKISAPEEVLPEKDPAIFLQLSLRFSKEYLEELCNMRKKHDDTEIQQSKELTIHHRALWTALIVEIRKLFGSSFREYKNFSLREIDFFKKDPYKGIINRVYGDQIIQKVLSTSHTFTVHLGKNKKEILPVREICDSNIENLLIKLQGPIDAFIKYRRGK